MGKHDIGRRELLWGLGGAGALAALSPFVPLLPGRADGHAPMRLLLFVTPMGMSSRYPDVWRPQGAEGNVFSPGGVLEPLSEFSGRLLCVNGLTNQAAIDSRLPGAHPVGYGTMLTGARLVPGAGIVGGGARDWRAHTGAPSIDQFVAGQLGVRSIEAMVWERDSLPATYKTRVSFRTPSEPVTPVIDPAAIFRRFWGEPDATMEEAEIARRREGHILDFVSEDLARVRARVGQDERHKIDAHLAALERAQGELNAAQSSCAAPEVGPGRAIAARSRAHLTQIVSAFACDLAGVATVMYGASPHGWRFEWAPGGGLTEGFHTQSHKGRSDAQAQDDQILALRWYASEMAELLRMLDAVPEGDGTLLDHTVVAWTTEVSDGNNHSFRNMPYVIAGGGAHFASGRYLSFPGQSHNRVLTSLCHAVGLEDVERYGDPEYDAGPLAGLRG